MQQYICSTVLAQLNRIASFCQQPGSLCRPLIKLLTFVACAVARKASKRILSALTTRSSCLQAGWWWSGRRRRSTGRRTHGQLPRVRRPRRAAGGGGEGWRRGGGAPAAGGEPGARPVRHLRQPQLAAPPCRGQRTPRGTHAC